MTKGIELEPVPRPHLSAQTTSDYFLPDVHVSGSSGVAARRGTNDHLSVQSSSSAQEDQEEIDYPDGGLAANLVAFGSFMGCVVVMGIVNSIGAIQVYVSTHQLKDLSTVAISWAFSVFLSLTYFLGIVGGPIFDAKGPLPLLLPSTLFIFAGLFGAASSTKIWHFILSFFVLGSGNGLAMTPLISSISHWFKKRRANYTGIAMAGGLVGGLVFPLLLHFLYAKYGFEWAMRIFAFLCVGCMLFPIVLVKPRIQGHARPAHFGWALIASVFKSLNPKRFLLPLFAFLLAGGILAELLLTLLLTYFASYAISHGVSESTSFVLISVWNAVSIIGRLVPGYVADKAGCYNVNIVLMAMFCIFCFGLWLPARGNVPALYAFAVVGGFSTGSVFSLLPACFALITPVSEVGGTNGIVYAMCGLGNLFGLPIASAFITSERAHEYDMFAIFVGLVAVAALVFWYAGRYSMVGFKVNVRV